MLRRLLFLFVFVSTVRHNALLSCAAERLKPNAPVEPGRLGRDVNPFIGTGGTFYLCGNNFPGATVPFGMVRLSPDTVSLLGKRATNSSGYFHSDPRMVGFSHTRLVGTGATDGGNFLVIPALEDSAKSCRRGMNQAHSHEDEIAFPGYYGIGFPGNGITAELTATPRVGIHRYTFPPGQAPHILIHVTSALGKGTSRAGQIRVNPISGEIEGSATTFGTFSKRYGGLTAYFVARFDRPIAQFTTWNGEADDSEQRELAGDDLGIDLGFDSAQRVIELKVAISYVSVANARANLDREAGQTTFDQAMTQAINRWEDVLSLTEVSGGTARERTIFRTALYRAFQMPTNFNDVNGQYLGFDRQVHQADNFQYYTDLSLWDTFRTVHPLYNLIARDHQRDMIVSLLKMVEQGGDLPRWPSGVGYTNSMFGTPADIMITESYLKGIRDFDAQAAYAAMRKTALGSVAPGSKFSGRVGIEHYLAHQYCPSDLMKKSVASTIEYCYADHAIALLADALGHTQDAVRFRQHARHYQNLWNPDTQFFQPRNSQGQFQPFQPELLTYLDPTGKLTNGYVEGSAWQWRWGVPSDADHVVSLFKSREFFVEQLEQFFARSPEGVGLNPNAFYWQGNQPDLYAAYLFNHAGRPDLTQKWVRWILEHKYGDSENGLDGNDDGGTLSAWYILSSLGLFPTAGTDRYELGSPLWDRATLKLGDQSLTIIAQRSSPEDRYVHSVHLNEVPLNRTWLQHRELAKGGTLQFEMTSHPPSLAR